MVSSRFETSVSSSSFSRASLFFSLRKLSLSFFNALVVSSRLEFSAFRVLASSLSLVISFSSSTFTAVIFSIELFFLLSQSLCFSILSVRPPTFIFFAFLVRIISLSATRFICFFIVFISLNLILTWSLSFFFLASSSKFSASSLLHFSLRFFSSDSFSSSCSFFIFILVFIS